MRGMSRPGGSGGSAVDTILKTAPILCSFIAFLFMAIALSSGNKPNHLENLNIIHFNTTNFGLNNLTDIENKAKKACGDIGDKIDGVVDTVKGGAEDAAKGAQDAVNSAGDAAKGAADTVAGIFGRDELEDRGVIGDALGNVCGDVVKAAGDFVDKLTAALGIMPYYSVHIGVLCEGNSTKSVQNCSPKFVAEKTDISKSLDSEMQVGPVKYKLSDIGLVHEIQESFDKISKAVARVAYPFLIIVIILATGFLCTIAVLVFEYVLHSMQKFALFAALGSLGLGSFALFICAAVTTGIAEVAKKEVNKHGGKFGISAGTSPALYFLLWGSVAFSAAALGMLAFLFVKTRNGAGMGGGHRGQEQYAEKNMSDSSMEDSHGFARMPTEGGMANRGFREEPL